MVHELERSRANATHKLIVFDNGTRAYYNLQADPAEQQNLFESTLSAEAATVLQELNQALVRIRG